MAVKAITEQWEVQYARFVYYPPLSSLEEAAATLHPSFTPHSTMKRKRSRGGVWISSSSNSIASEATVSSAATLKLTADCSAGSDDAILNVSLRNKVIVRSFARFLPFSF